MTVLGAVLAGGRSRRFGSDKAAASFRGQPLIAHTLAALSRQCDAVVVVGRDQPGKVSVPDWPRAGCGPLGGFAGAFRYAVASGFDLVLTAGVDSIDLPDDLRARLTPAPAYVASQPVLGLWPAAGVGALEEILHGSDSHSVRAFANRIGARAVKLAAEPANVNTPDDLTRLEQRHGL